MMKKSVILLLGLGIGALCGWFSVQQMAPKAAVVEAPAVVASKPAGSSLALPPPTVVQHGNGPSVISSSSSANDQLAIGESEIDQKEFEKKAMEHLKKQMKERTEMQIKERLAAMKERLHLTDDQVAKIRPLLDPNLTDGAVINLDGNAAAGQFGMRETTEQRKAREAKIDDLLSDDQKKDYDEFKKQQRENKIEVNTNEDLMQLQRDLTLTPEQKDKAFQALRDLATREVDTNEDGPIQGPQLKEKMENRRNAIKDILTPQQLEAYDKSPLSGLNGPGGAKVMVETLNLPLKGGTTPPPAGGK